MILLEIDGFMVLHSPTNVTGSSPKQRMTEVVQFLYC